mmetsp:Transcript_25054/g.83599  ORF Transcript_25054/g.83599 Transcript_25054/m.83599 type:complete len:240 (+) Transcript_25054:1626-2345(+)
MQPWSPQVCPSGHTAQTLPTRPPLQVPGPPPGHEFMSILHLKELRGSLGLLQWCFSSVGIGNRGSSANLAKLSNLLPKGQTIPGGHGAHGPMTVPPSMRNESSAQAQSMSCVAARNSVVIPTGHVTQIESFMVLYVPSAHRSHDVAPNSSVKKPWSQVLHWPCPGIGAQVFSGHSEGFEEPCSAYSPGLQKVHADEPVVDANVPWMHGEHLIGLLSAFAKPTSQSTHVYSVFGFPNTFR